MPVTMGQGGERDGLGVRCARTGTIGACSAVCGISRSHSNEGGLGGAGSVLDIRGRPVPRATNYRGCTGRRPCASCFLKRYWCRLRLLRLRRGESDGSTPLLPNVDGGNGTEGEQVCWLMRQDLTCARVDESAIRHGDKAWAGLACRGVKACGDEPLLGGVGIDAEASASTHAKLVGALGDEVIQGAAQEGVGHDGGDGRGDGRRGGGGWRAAGGPGIRDGGVARDEGNRLAGAGGGELGELGCGGGGGGGAGVWCMRRQGQIGRVARGGGAGEDVEDVGRGEAASAGDGIGDSVPAGVGRGGEDVEEVADTDGLVVGSAGDEGLACAENKERGLLADGGHGGGGGGGGRRVWLGRCAQAAAQRCEVHRQGVAGNGGGGEEGGGNGWSRERVGLHAARARAGAVLRARCATPRHATPAGGRVR